MTGCWTEAPTPTRRLALVELAVPVAVSVKVVSAGSGAVAMLVRPVTSWLENEPPLSEREMALATVHERVVVPLAGTLAGLAVKLEMTGPRIMPTRVLT